MNVPFYIILAVDAIVILISTEASPRWSRNSKPKYKRWNHYGSEINHICSIGQCVPAWKCPEEAIFRESTGSCMYRSDGPWVCCDTDKGSKQWTKADFATNPSTQVHRGYPGQSATSRRKRKTTAKNYYDTEDNLSTPCPTDSWNRNAGENHAPRNSVEDIPGHSRNRFSSSTQKPTKFPESTTRKTTAASRNKLTTPTSFVTRTTKKKTETSDPRIVFPTESNGWTQKVTKHSVYHTPTPRTTKYPDNKSTTKVPSSTTKSTTRADWRPSTKHTATTANNRKPTSSTRTWANDGSNSEEKKHQGRVPLSTALPNQGHGASTRPTTRRSSSRTTVKTTTKYRITTPLPNVNTYMCGTRDEGPVTNRQRRNYSPSSVNVFRSGSHSRKPYQRIVGGEEVEPFSWPWVAAMYKVASSGGHRFLSAGSLINENFVLTAAHVFTPDDLKSASYVVMLGTHNAQDAVAEYSVGSVLPHPRYEHRYYYHDIALLRLVRPVAFNDYVMPVCLPSPDAPLLRDRDLEGKSVTVMGWGDDSFGGKSSRVLKEATFPIASRVSCNASYVRVASSRFPRGITEEMLCAGDPNGGKDACQGDSGGPLTSMERGRYTQVGIVSFGYQCGDKEFPGVYTKVAPYLSWIAENTKNIDYGNDYDYRG